VSRPAFRASPHGLCALVQSSDRAQSACYRAAGKYSVSLDPGAEWTSGMHGSGRGVEERLARRAAGYKAVPVTWIGQPAGMRTAAATARQSAMSRRRATQMLMEAERDDALLDEVEHAAAAAAVVGEVAYQPAGVGSRVPKPPSPPLARGALAPPRLAVPTPTHVPATASGTATLAPGSLHPAAMTSSRSVSPLADAFSSPFTAHRPAHQAPVTHTSRPTPTAGAILSSDALFGVPGETSSGLDGGGGGGSGGGGGRGGVDRFAGGVGTPLPSGGSMGSPVAAALLPPGAKVSRRLAPAMHNVRRWAHELQQHLWMTSVPATLRSAGGDGGWGGGDMDGGSAEGTAWMVAPRPEGEHCLVVASGGRTMVRDWHGFLMATFQSALPGGSAASQLVRPGGEPLGTILDCVFNPEAGVFWVLDFVQWERMHAEDYPYRMRHWLLTDKLTETPLAGTVTVPPGWPRVLVDAPRGASAHARKGGRAGASGRAGVGGVTHSAPADVSDVGMAPMFGWVTNASDPRDEVAIAAAGDDDDDGAAGRDDAPAGHGAVSSADQEHATDVAWSRSMLPSPGDGLRVRAAATTGVAAGTYTPTPLADGSPVVTRHRSFDGGGDRRGRASNDAGSAGSGDSATAASLDLGHGGSDYDSDEGMRVMPGGPRSRKARGRAHTSDAPGAPSLVDGVLSTSTSGSSSVDSMHTATAATDVGAGRGGGTTGGGIAAYMHLLAAGGRTIVPSTATPHADPPSPLPGRYSHLPLAVNEYAFRLLPAEVLSSTTLRAAYSADLGCSKVGGGGGGGGRRLHPRRASHPFARNPSSPLCRMVYCSWRVMGRT